MKTRSFAFVAGVVMAAALVAKAETMLPFEKYVNWGYTDAVKGDVKGGWTDEGPNQDARFFPFGQKTFAGVPFRIVDEKKNGGKAIFTFRGWQCNNKFLNASVPLEKPESAKFLYLLHALDVDGTRLEEIPLTAKASAVTFTLDTKKLKVPSVYFELAEK